jgi:hypothetical protein
MKSPLVRTLAVGFLAVGLLAACVSGASLRVSAARHPNLAAAQTNIENAIAKISAAQNANEFDLKGHAAKAKDLLGQAYAEIKLAAEAANARK